MARLKLALLAGVGGCGVLLASFIAASCIYTARRREASLQVTSHDIFMTSPCHHHVITMTSS